MIETAARKSCEAKVLPREDRVRTLGQRRGYSPLLWLNLVCLDAPIVAVSWQWLFARSFGIEVSRATTAALFLTAWLIYLADRFADMLSLDQTVPTSLRQRFCFAHRRAWISLIAVIALADLAMVMTRLDPMAMFVGFVIGAGALLYLAINRLQPSLWRLLPLKEISIGFIFAAGTMVGLLRGLTSAALPSWLLFAGLCALNCICIAVWERELDAAQERTSIATVFPEIGCWLLPALVLLMLASFLLAPYGSLAASLYACVGASAFLLTLVHLFRSQLQPDVRTALADLVLLTPLVVWLTAASQFSISL